MGNDDSDRCRADRIREKIAEYRRSADAARRKADEAALPEVRKSYLRMAEGFNKLVRDFEKALKRTEQ
jgi:hypothetical protein